MPSVTFGEVECFYEVEGAGEPLVLIPGFAAGRWLWFKQTGPLSDCFQVITFDPRGISRSGRSAVAQTISEIAGDVAGLMRAIGIESAHIVGASFGGFVAQELALSHPKLLRSLTLCCTSFGGACHVPPASDTLLALASTKGLNTEERVRQNLLIAFSETFIRDHPDEIEEVIRMRGSSEVSEQAYLGQLQAAMAFNAETRVKDIATPTLVLSGDKDVIVPVENSYNLAAAIPAAQLAVMQGGSHMFFIERPEAFNRLVTEFVRGQLSVVRS